MARKEAVPLHDLPTNKLLHYNGEIKVLRIFFKYAKLGTLNLVCDPTQRILCRKTRKEAQLKQYRVMSSSTMLQYVNQTIGQ